MPFTSAFRPAIYIKISAPHKPYGLTYRKRVQHANHCLSISEEALSLTLAVSLRQRLNAVSALSMFRQLCWEQSTLLCGKTGINFNGLKNEIGVFREADSVIISSLFFGTLPEKELKSGYAEMIKHGLLENTSAYRDLTEYDFSDTTDTRLLSLLRQSVETKRRIVDADPYEKGVRRALNLGHTAGHAFESMAMQRQSPVPHGYAVAWGLVVEAVISHLEKGFPSSTLYHLAAFVLRHYGTFHITCDDYPELLRLMRHDKKSENGEYNFSLLKEIGEVETGCHITGNTVEAALDIFRDLMHI